MRCRQGSVPSRKQSPILAFANTRTNLSGQSHEAGRGRSAASASFLAAKAELLGTQDAMLSEAWEVAHLVEAAERRRFVEVVLTMSRKWS